MAKIETQRTEAYRTPKIPKFFREDLISFFVIVEATFRQARIHLESTKADYLIASLDHDFIPHIKHLIEMEPKPIDIYTQIKNTLIASFSVCAETRLRRLLIGEVISEGKLSLLLTRLRTLNDGNCTDNIIRSVFSEQMPSNIRAILAMANVENLQELANLADKISEAAQPLNYQVSAASSSPNIVANTSSVSVPVDPFASMADILTKQFDTLPNEIRNLKATPQHRGRTNSRNFQRNNRSRSRSSHSRCYYHQRFGKNANKCSQPCSWRVLTTPSVSIFGHLLASSGFQNLKTKAKRSRVVRGQ